MSHMDRHCQWRRQFWPEFSVGNGDPDRGRTRLYTAGRRGAAALLDRQSGAGAEVLPQPESDWPSFQHGRFQYEEPELARDYWRIRRYVRYSHLQDEPPPLHFDLYRQSKDIGDATYIVRTRMKPDAIVPSLRAVVQGIDRGLPLMDVRTQRQQIDRHPFRSSASSPV